MMINDLINDLRDQLKPCPFCGRKVNLVSLQMGSNIGVARMDVECACGISFEIYADDVIYSADGTPHQMGLTALDKWEKRSK